MHKHFYLLVLVSVATMIADVSKKCMTKQKWKLQLRANFRFLRHSKKFIIAEKYADISELTLLDMYTEVPDNKMFDSFIKRCSLLYQIQKCKEANLYECSCPSCAEYAICKHFLCYLNHILTTSNISSATQDSTLISGRRKSGRPKKHSNCLEKPVAV